MLKNKKLSCSQITIAILSSFLPYSVHADNITFDANGNYPTQPTSEPTFDASASSSSTGLATNVPPSSQIGQLPVVPSEVRKNAARASFESASVRASGLTPDMIREFKKNQAEKNRAMDEVVDAPRPESRTISFNLGVSPQKEVIRTAIGYATSISVVDSTGRPWDVLNTTIGNSKAFSLNRLDGPEGNLFSLTNLEPGRSNLILLLKEGKANGIKVPIVLDLVSGQSTVDDRIVLRIQSIGPNGSIEQANLTQGINSDYIKWLDGVVPSSARKLKSDDKFVKAWRDKDGSFVVITKYLVYSPTATVMLESSDGVATLYKLSSKSSVLRVRDKDTKEEKKVTITGF